MWHVAAPHLAALLLYTLLALLVTWPLAASFTEGVVGAVGGVDAYQGAWGLWWTARALLSGRSPFFSPLLYFPQGVDLFWQTLGFSQGAAALPVTLALGPVAAVNATVLTSYALGGYATFLLARRVTGSAPAALVAGAVYAFSPYHLEKVLDGNLEVAAIHWLPCYALALHLLLERPGLRRALLAGALLVWVGLGSWYYGLFALMYTGMAAALWALGNGKRKAQSAEQDAANSAGEGGSGLPFALSARRFAWGLAPILIWALALAPRLAGLAGGETVLMDMRPVIAERSADLLDFFLPNPRHPWWGAAVTAARERVYPGAVIWNVALGSVGLALALAPLVVGRRVIHEGHEGASVSEGRGSPRESSTVPARARHRSEDLRTLRVLRGSNGSWRWWLLLAASLVLAMGPTLRMAGWDTGLPLPFALLQHLPGVRSGQRPNHMAVFGILALAVLAAHGFTAIFETRGHEGTRARRTGGRRGTILPYRRSGAGVPPPFVRWYGARRPRTGAPSFAPSRLRVFVFSVGIVALIAFVDGYAGPTTIVRRPVHPFYTSLPAPDGALMALPMLLNINRSDHLTPQTAHGWPILGGYVARPPRYDFPRYVPGARELEQGRAAPEDIVAPGWPESGRRALAAYGIRYVALDLTAQRDTGRFGLGKAEYFAQVRGLLAELGADPPLVADADLEAYAIPRAWPVAPLAYLGAGWQPVERQAGTPYRWRWMGERAEIRLYNPHDRPAPARLTIAASAYERERPVRLALDGAGLGELLVAPGEPHARALWLMLPPGEHVLSLEAESARDPGRAEPISVRLFGVELRAAGE